MNTIKKGEVKLFQFLVLLIELGIPTRTFLEHLGSGTVDNCCTYTVGRQKLDLPKTPLPGTNHGRNSLTSCRLVFGILLLFIIG